MHCAQPPTKPPHTVDFSISQSSACHRTHPRINIAVSTLQDPAKAQDVSTLMEALSTSHKGQQVVLSPETLKPPRMSTPGATLLPMWPRHTPPTNRQIASGLFSLGWYPDSPAPSTAKGYLGYMYSLPSALGGGHKGSETIVCSLTGAHTHLSGAGGATLQLSDTTALVMDSSCEGVTFSDLTFSGALAPTTFSESVLFERVLQTMPRLIEGYEAPSEGSTIGLLALTRECDHLAC